MGMLFLCILLQLLAIVAVIVGVALIINRGVTPVGGVVVAVGAIYTCFGWISFLGLKILKPQEALVLTLFGEYIGTLKGEGFYYVNPFSSAVNSAAGKGMATASEDQNPISIPGASSNINVNLNEMLSKKISLKTMTLNNNKQKVNDALGNPIEIGIVVIWRIVNTAKAVFNVDNYKAFYPFKVIRPFETLQDYTPMTWPRVARNCLCGEAVKRWLTSLKLKFKKG